MFQILRERLTQGQSTLAYPAGEVPSVSDRYRGLPVLDQSKCPSGCAECLSACPTDAISQSANGLKLDLGRCLFCTNCLEACPEGAIGFSNSFLLATRRRDDLVFDGRELKLAEALDAKILSVLGRSLSLLHVSGGDSGCDAEVQALESVAFDLNRFGIKFVTSPQHADGLLIAGRVNKNMQEALQLTYAAMSMPKLVIAVGAGAISGAPFGSESEQCGGLEGLLPIDLYIPGNPPHPLTILDGLLRLLNRLHSQ